jgi:L-ascorbate metabolism protein UlaG (beta-lactamase superfamily)
VTVKVTFLGSATFLLEDPTGHLAVIDPWLDAEPGNPGCPLKVEDLAHADLVLVTHGDPAHYGRADSVRIASLAGCPFASNVPLCEYVLSKGLLPKSQVLPLALDTRHKLGFLEVTVFPVIHPTDWIPPAGYEIPREPNTGFALSMGEASIMYTGDTILDDDIYKKVATEYKPTLGLIPVASPTAGHGTLEESAVVAAFVARVAGVKYMIPHYRFVPNNPSVDMLASELRGTNIQLIRLEPGESFTLKDGV